VDVDSTLEILQLTHGNIVFILLLVAKLFLTLLILPTLGVVLDVVPVLKLFPQVIAPQVGHVPQAHHPL